MRFYVDQLQKNTNVYQFEYYYTYNGGHLGFWPKITVCHMSIRVDFLRVCTPAMNSSEKTLLTFLFNLHCFYHFLAYSLNHDKIIIQLIGSRQSFFAHTLWGTLSCLKKFDIFHYHGNKIKKTYQIQQLRAYDANISNKCISQLQYICALNKVGDNFVRRSCCTAKVAAHRYDHLVFVCVTSPCLILISFVPQEPDKCLSSYFLGKLS